jgi:hypothetical protein
MDQHIHVLERLYADVLAHRKENSGDAIYPTNTTGTVAHHL